MLDDLRGCARVPSGWNTTMSSTRLMNSGRKCCRTISMHRRLHLLVIRLARHLLDDLRAEVRGHDDDRVAEIDGATLPVRQAAVVEHLQQHVEDVGCAFSTSSSRITEYGRRRTASVR